MCVRNDYHITYRKNIQNDALVLIYYYTIMATYSPGGTQ